MSDFYILDGEQRPVKVEGPDAVLEWGRWFEVADEERRVALDEVGGACISTVFLGLDHNWSDDGPPILYETMIFAHGTDLDQETCRYATRSEALSGHEAACQRVREAIKVVA